MAVEAPSMPLDAARIKLDFPILNREVNGKLPAYLDSAASAQKPRQVIDTIVDVYETSYAAVHRAVYTLGERATERYEGARDIVTAFLNAPSRREIIFVRNATEGINLVAYAYGLRFLGKGDVIVSTEMEHHSNLVPWQLLCERTGATLDWVPVDDAGRLVLDALDEKLSRGDVKLVAVAHVSNVVGTINPIADIARRAHAAGAVVVVDGSQAVPQIPVDVAALGVDFYAFTGHKMVGPTGIGVLWGRRELLDELPPFLGGGEMIETVRMTRSTYAPIPYKFEAGTMPIAQSVGLGAAVDYLTALGMDAVAAHEREITAYALERLHDVPGLTIIGPDTPVDRGGAVSFTLAGVHPHDVAQVLDSLGVAVRAGHHCAKPVCDRFGIPASTRASFYLYTTRNEVDALVRGLDEVRKVFG